MASVFKIIIFFSLLACGQNKGVAPGSSSGSNNGNSAPACTTCKIFVTASAYQGNLGGVTGGDAKCMSDSNKPSGGGTYKALLGGPTRNTTATDWVLQANTIYTRPNGTTIGTTTASKTFSTMTNSISASNFLVWTGLYTDYSVDTTHCNYWTTSAAASGASGASGLTISAVNIGLGMSCSNSQNLYCVEQ